MFFKVATSPTEPSPARWLLSCLHKRYRHFFLFQLKYIIFAPSVCTVVTVDLEKISGADLIDDLLHNGASLHEAPSGGSHIQGSKLEVGLSTGQENPELMSKATVSSWAAALEQSQTAASSHPPRMLVKRWTDGSPPSKDDGGPNGKDDHGGGAPSTKGGGQGRNRPHELAKAATPAPAKQASAWRLGDRRGNQCWCRTLPSTHSALPWPPPARRSAVCCLCSFGCRVDRAHCTTIQHTSDVLSAMLLTPIVLGIFRTVDDHRR